MPTYKVAYNAVTKIATIQKSGDSLPTGSTSLGTFKHDDPQDVLGITVAGDNSPIPENHVFWHHVRNLLYKAGQQNMQIVKILMDSDYIALVSFTATPTPISKAAGQTQQIAHVFTPANASNKAVIYTTSAPSKATVSNTGLITFVAAGTATITCTTDDGAFVQTIAVTVT